jgi:DNA transformation protein
MAVSADFHAFVVEQLEQARAPVTAKRMFGGMGLYCGGLFFALLDDDTLYLKVDSVNRPDFEALGLTPFDPFQDGFRLMQYYPVSADVLEDSEALPPWMEGALAAAVRAQEKKGKGKRS